MNELQSKLTKLDKEKAASQSRLDKLQGKLESEKGDAVRENQIII
jgi:hypothetical protein